MSSVTATINVNINAANAAAQLAGLQSKVATMNKGMLAATAGGVMAQEKAIKRMGNVLSGSGMFTTGIRNVHTQLGRMHQEFDRGSTTLSRYRQNSKMWSNDHSRINAIAADRVRMLQSQYVALGKEMNGVQKAMQIKPDRMMREFGADAMYANQRAMLFRRNLQMGATSLVNWGKNTQWAGRQMMVGMGIPIAIVSAGAIKSFNEIEKASIAFKRVYGDTATSVSEKSQMLSNVQKGVAKDMMQYGISMADTLDVAAKAAATGAQGADLIAATRETMRLATLGNMDYQKALEATIAMQTAFSISSEDMGQKTDFLNAVENQTILSMEDMALAVPRVAPVIKGLGGGIEELAIMMTALRQGGVTAEQGANALKSGLASMINPTATATEALGNMGINLDKIVKANKGDIIGTVQGLGKALEGLSKFKRQQALESLFGKYQYARMGALLKNINSKAVKETMRLAKAPASELAKMSEQELSQISESPMIKLRKSIEELKAAAAPLGAVLSDIGAKVISFITPMVSFFSNNSWARGFLLGVAGIAAVAGTLTMIVGVLANFAGSMVKAGMAVKNFFRIITGRGSLAYVASEELEATAAANSLASASERAAQAHMAQANAAKLLVSELNALAAAQLKAAGATSAVGTRPVATAPKTTAPGALPAYNQAQVAAMLAKEGQTVRSHVGNPMKPTAAQTAAILAYHQPKADAGVKSSMAMVEALKAGNVRTYSAMALGWGAQTNLELSDTAKNSSVARERLLGQLQMRPSEVMAPFIDDLARNAGITREQVMADPRVQAWAGSAVKSLHEGIAQSTVQNWKDSDVAKVAQPILSTVKDIAPEYNKAYTKMMLPEQYGISGQSRITLQQGVVQNAPESFATYRPKTTKTGDAVAAANKLMPLRIGESAPTVAPNAPILIADNNGTIKGAVIPETAQSKSLASKSLGSLGSGRTYTGFKGGLTPPSGKVPTPTPTKIAQPRQFTGGGLMGAGMLASTAMMGLQMAGKEVPAAAEFAAQGLMGVGMTAMMFPGTMAKLSGGLGAVVTALGPWGIAIGAAAAAIGGTALLWKQFNQNTRQQGIDLGRSLNDTTSSIDAVGQAFGKTSYVQEQLAKQQGVTTDQLTAAEQFIQSDAGKKLLDDYAATSMKVSQNVAGTSMASKLASYVISGVMGTSDVKAFLGALKAESPAQGAQVERYVRGLMGAKMDKMPGTLASDIYKSQSGNTATTMELLRRQQAQAQGTSVIDSIKGMSISDKIITGLKAMVNPFSIPGEAVGMMLQNKMDVRGSVNRVGGMMASATNTQIQSGLQNRLALEAQLNMLLEERDTLQKSASKDALGADDAERLDYLNKVIPDVKTGITELGTALQSTSQGMDQMFSNAGKDQKDAVLDSLNTMIQESKDATAIFMADMARNDKSLSQQQQFGILSRLQNGALNPAGMQNMLTYAKTGMQGISSAVQTLPVGKLQSFSLEIGKMTGPQAQSALTNFGRRFINAAKAANLSGREAANAAKALGATPKQAKDVRVKVKMDKVDDITKGVNKKVTVSASTDSAKKKIDDLRKAAEKATGKKIKINASDNAGAVIARLRKLIKSAYEADATDPNVQTSTNAGETEGKVQSLSDTIMNIANVGPVDLNATDNASGPAEGATSAVNTFAALSPTVALNAVDGSTPVVSTAVSYLMSQEGKTAHTYIITHHRDEKAAGGLFSYATGGVHKGPGKVKGPGGPKDDKVNARLSNGEFVVKASSVNKYGTAFLNAVNQGALPGYKEGTPISAKNMNKDQREEYAKILNESRGIIKEFSKFSEILKHARAALGFGMKGMDQEFTQYIIDNYNPKQIEKMFAGKKDVGAKVIAKRFAHEQYGQEVRSQQKTVRSAQFRDSLLRKNDAWGKEGYKATAIGNMSDEQLAMYRGLKGKKNKKARQGFMKRLFDAEQINQQQEKFQEEKDKYKEAKDRKKSVLKSYQSATGATAFGVMPKVGAASINELNKYADALGMSIEEIAQQIEDGDLPSNFKELADKAVEAKKALEVLAMTEVEKQSERLSNNQSRMSNLQDLAGANARKAISAKYGKSQSELEAGNAVRDAQNAIDQATIDDINEKYDKQLNIIDQISQHQQAIANLERGRLTVANALSTGDIAAAAAAAQEHRNNMAAFAQDQMRNQLENQQKAATSALQDQINARMRESRDIQNQIALLTAQANLDQAAAIGAIQAENDEIMTTEGYIAAANAELETRNGLLAQGLATLQATVAAAAALAANVPQPTEPVAPPQIKVGGPAYKAKAAKPPKKKKKAFGGLVPGIGNSDSVHTMLTPGEFVIRKAQAAKFGPTLRDINAGSFKGGAINGGNVNIDNIIFQINGANLNERDVADIAVRKMRTLDAATIRGGRF